MPTRRALFSAAALPLLSNARPGHPDNWAQLLELASVPGSAVGLIKNGKLASAHYLGVRHATQKQPVTAQTVFAAASLTKPVAAWVALQLADAKVLELDRPIHDVLPFAQEERARRVTPRHVLSHSTGFPNWRFQPNQPLSCSFEPGSAFGYSGEGFYLLQQLMQKVAGRPFDRLMSERALDPFGMSNSALDASGIPNGEMATAHSRRGVPRAASSPSPANPSPLPVNLSPNAAASLLTTLPDYVRFAIGAMSRSDWFEPRTRITPHLSWGLGWGIEEFRGERWFWHWGDNPGFKNMILCRAGRKDGIVIFTNGDNGQAVYERIVRDALGDDHPILLWI